MHNARAHALAALVGASTVGCVEGEKGARPTSSASYSDGDDSSVYDPFESTTAGDTAGDSVGTPDPSGAASQGGTAGPDSTSGAGTTGPGGGADGSGSGGPTSGTASAGESTGHDATTGYYGTTGDYDTYGSYGYGPGGDDDVWFLGLGEVACGDVPLRICR